MAKDKMKKKLKKCVNCGERSMRDAAGNCGNCGQSKTEKLPDIPETETEKQDATAGPADPPKKKSKKQKLTLVRATVTLHVLISVPVGATTSADATIEASATAAGVLARQITTGPDVTVAECLITLNSAAEAQ